MLGGINVEVGTGVVVVSGAASGVSPFGVALAVFAGGSTVVIVVNGSDTVGEESSVGSDVGDFI